MANTFYKSQIEIINDIIHLAKHVKWKVPRYTTETEFLCTNKQNIKEINVLLCAIALIERPEVPDYRDRLNYDIKSSSISSC